MSLERHFSAIMDRCGSPFTPSALTVLIDHVLLTVMFQAITNRCDCPTSSMPVTSKVAHLRGAIKQWMMQQGSTEVWAGMAFKDLSMAMSSHRESYSDHIVRMATHGEWVDASAIHALAATFRVDCLIFQSKASPAIVGHSIMTGATGESLACINLAMVNDLHFWGVRPIRPPLLPAPDPGEWMRPDRLASANFDKLLI